MTFQFTDRGRTRSACVAVAGILLGVAGCGDGTGPVSTHRVSVQVSAKVAGRLALAMSTSFQPGTYDQFFFQSFPGAITPLGGLDPQHIRLQSLGDGNPQTTATTWDFSVLDAAAQPVLTVGDHSPELQLGQGAAFMYDSTGRLLDTTGRQFATYAAQMVRYYNTGGFTAGDGLHASPGSHRVTWWGIYNEPNINNMTAAQYTTLYNTTVPAMQAVDPSLQFVAAEVTGDLYTVQNYLPVAVGGIRARVDAVAIHFYSTCGHADIDTKLMATVPTFAQSVQATAATIALNPATASKPIWVTENNVDADFNLGNGTSACTGEPFVLDPRGTSAFFAAWRPYVFSQVGQAGAAALYHWVFAGDAQYGEFNQSTGSVTLSYWVDYWLARTFPSPPGADILVLTSNDAPDVETLAVRNDDGSVTVMVANHAVASAGDNNGRGAPAAVSLDLSALGTFQSASLLILDARTDPTREPVPTSVPVGPMMTVTLPGYGVAFLTMH